MPNQRPPGTGVYSDEATIPGSGFDYDDPVSSQDAMYGGGMSGEYQDTAGEEDYDYGDEGSAEEPDESDDLYGPDDDELYSGEEESDILESPRRIGED
jgi:hypothetical protein